MKTAGSLIVSMMVFGLSACENDRSMRTHNDHMNGEESGMMNRSGSDISDERDILAFLHATNVKEIEMGRLAQQRGSGDAVRRFGAALERDHMNSQGAVTSAASSLGVSTTDLEASSSGGGDQSDAASPLRTLEGSEFDREFARAMQAGHRDAIARVEAARQRVNDERVRTLLAETLPVLRKHEQTASSILESMP